MVISAWYINSEGIVTVDGVGSAWINTAALGIGGFGNGTLTILNGGNVTSRTGSIATPTHFGGGIGTVLVDGPGSLWNNSQGLYVNGSLTTRNGGAVVSDSAYVDGAGMIDGAGSMWTTGVVLIASTLSGTLTIHNGGVLSSDDFAVVGNSAHGYGRVDVDGAGSRWTNDFDQVQLNVGYTGPGTLNITNGGVVSTFGAGIGPDGNGHVMVDGTGSAFHVCTNLYVGGGDVGNDVEAGGMGHVQITSDAEISATSVTIFGRGTLVDDAALMSPLVSIVPGGSLEGNGNVAGDVTNAGHVQPGDPIGVFTIAGNYTQLSTGTLTVEIGGVPGNAHDYLNITGDATLGGALEVRFVNGFLPVHGQVFEVIDVSGAVTGSFEQIIFPDLRSGFQFSAAFANGVYRITALSDGAPAVGLSNISTRGQVGAGDNALIGGFIVTGAVSKKVIIRGLGPSLAVGGTPLPGRLADPTLELRDNTGALIFSNDNWMNSSQRQAIIDSGIPPGDTHEAAIVETLAPGNYTAIMRGVGDTTGIGIVEVYDLAPEVDAQLGNISTRGVVATGDNVMIGGFIVENQDTRVLLRALGPSLTPAGVSNALADPTLELHDGNGDVVAFNNDWEDTDAADIENTGIAPTYTEEAAIIATLGPGHFTAIVRGRNNTSGVGLFEGYNLR